MNFKKKDRSKYNIFLLFLWIIYIHTGLDIMKFNKIKFS